MFYIHIIPQLKDNYSYVLRDEHNNITCVVDPSTSEQVEIFLDKHNWKLDYILNTHHHHDHIGGNNKLKDKYNAKIIASKYDEDRIENIDIKVSDNEEINFPSVCRILYIPGHTLGHIAYYFPKEEALFCGDTLFSLGCGRLFEGTAAQMYHSLMRLTKLPISTKIYPGHEYTLNNVKFTMTIDTDNNDLYEFYQIIQNKRDKGEVTIPSAIEKELKFNPFLRINDDKMQNKFQLSNPVELFAKLRKLKDEF